MIKTCKIKKKKSTRAISNETNKEHILVVLRRYYLDITIQLNVQL